jgi:hypothetical protein
MQTIPLQALPNQTMQVQLGTQNCTLSVFQFAYGLFATLLVGATGIVVSAPCQNGNRLVRDAYLGFSGDLAFVDTQGSADPVYTGLGTRWQLLYFAPADLAALGLSS